MRTWVSGIICVVMLGLCGVAFAQQSFYSIHISSHRQQAKADAEVKKHEAQGLDAFSRYEQVPGKGMWYRIYIGKYATKTEAAADMNRLRQKKVSKYFAIRSISGEKPKKEAAAADQTTENYFLFVGFHRDLQPARKEVSRLTQSLSPYGYRVLLTREKVSEGTNYRVYVGTFASRQQAAAVGTQLKEKKLITSFYIPVPTTQDMLTGLMPAAPKSTSEDKPEAAQKGRAKKPSAEKKTAAVDRGDFSRFALMFKGGVFSPQKTDTFSVEIGSITYRVSDDAAPQIGVEAVLRFNQTIGLYGGADTVFIDGIDWYNFAAGPILTFQSSESVMPYLKAGAVYGDFSWDAPGEFDSSFGWEGAAGFNFLESNFKLGVEIAYRDMSFDYKPPSGAVVTPSDNSLDLSGFSVMASFSYWF